MFNLGAFKKSVNDFQSQLADIRCEIETKKQQRDDLETLPFSRKNLANLECAKIDSLGKQYVENLSVALSCRIQKPLADYPGLDVLKANGGGTSIPTVNLAWLLRDLIKERLRDAIMHPNFKWPDDSECGLPQAERKPVLEKLNKEIEALEAKEAAMRQEAASIGVHIDKVDPRPAAGAYGGGVRK